MVFAEPVPAVPAVAEFVAALVPPCAVTIVPEVPNVVAVPLTTELAATQLKATCPEAP
jgi:hypothetical protein